MAEPHLRLPGTERRFWALVVATGAVSGLGAVVLLWLLRSVQRLCWGTPDAFLQGVRAAEPLHRLLVPALGGVLVTAVWLLVKTPIGGHGTAGIIESIWLKGGLLSLRRALLRGTTSIVVVGMGASLGREGALIQTGAAFGSWLGRRFGVTHKEARLLVACGAASGIAAAYNVPIGGALYGLEVLLGSFALELLGPIVASCVVSTIISRALVASHPSYAIPHYAFRAPEILLAAAAFAPLLGLASVLFVKGIDGVPDLLGRVPSRLKPFLPIAAMTLLGAVAFRFPELLGNGYDTVNAALLGNVALGLLFALPALKLIVTALCSGSGVPGGLFTPSLFVGALLGGGLGQLVERLWPGAAPSGAWALLGMGGILAGSTHAAVSSVLIIFELTGNYDVILPLMLVCAVSAAVSRRLSPDSLYTSVLRRRNVEPPELPEPQWLRERPVEKLIQPEGDGIPPDLPFAQVVVKLLALPPDHDLYVTGDGRRLLGIIQLDALKAHLPDETKAASAVAGDVMNASLIPLTPSMSLDEVASIFAKTDLERLPVVDAEGRLLGAVSVRDVLRLGRF